MALSLLVFDCDGILLENLDIKSKAFYRLGKEFSDEAADRLLMYHQLHGGVSRYRKFEWLYQEFKGRAITDEEKEELNKKFVDISFDEIVKSKLVPGAQQVLDAWKGRLPMYVASGAPEHELRLVLEKRGLSRYFDGIYGSPAPKSQILRCIVQFTGVRPYNAVMIGDSRTDQYAAEAVGMRFYGRGEYFKPSGHPWHEDLTELNAHLEELHAEA